MSGTQTRETNEGVREAVVSIERDCPRCHSVLVKNDKEIVTNASTAATFTAGATATNDSA